MIMLSQLRDAATHTGDSLRRGGAGLRKGGVELRRRADLARQPRPQGVSTPPLALLWRELAVLLGGRRGPEHVAPAQRPLPVMILPGFGAHPARMRHMAVALEAAGHRVYDWGLGANFGPTVENFAFLLARVSRIARIEGEPVALVGWSLGGLFAREIAKARPEAVAKVITMGTPFSGDRRANNAWRAYQVITGHAVDAPPIAGDFAVKPPVPTVALWSPKDGIIAPRSACGWPGERDRAVALRCSHLGFSGSPAAITAVLRELDYPEVGAAPDAQTPVPAGRTAAMAARPLGADAISPGVTAA